MVLASRCRVVINCGGSEEHEARRYRDNAYASNGSRYDGPPPVLSQPIPVLPQKDESRGQHGATAQELTDAEPRQRPCRAMPKFSH